MTLTLHAADVVLTNDATNRDGEPIRDGAVLVDGDTVTAVGERRELMARYPAARVRTWSGVVTPGLVNAHAHLQYSDYGNLATTGLPFDRWITRLQQRRETFTETQWAEGTRRGLHLALRSGTTAIADVVSDEGPLLPTARSSIEGVSYVEVVGADSRVWADERRATTLARLDSAPTGRRLGLSPHAPYTVGSAVITEIAGLARERGLRMHPHLAESDAETQYVREGSGQFADLNARLGIAMELMGCGAACSPTAYVDSLGALGPDVHVAHGVQVDADDRALLRERGVVVALCVRSNRILGAGEPPVAAYLDEGNSIAVGTDSLASTPSLDLLDEARALRDVARAQGYDAADLDRRIVEAATVGGARAMGLSDVGVLRPGVRADLAVFDVPTTANGAAGTVGAAGTARTVGAGSTDGVYRSLLDHGGGRCVATVLGGRLVHRR